MKAKQILTLALTAAMLLAACGKQDKVFQPESESVPESGISSEKIESSESMEEFWSESKDDLEESGDTEMSFPYPEHMLELPEINGSTPEWIEYATEGRLLLSYRTEDGCKAMLYQPDTGACSDPVEFSQYSRIFRLPAGYSYQIYDAEKNTSETLYFDNEMQPCTAEKAGIPDNVGYSMDYSEDGAYLQVTRPDGTVENIAETGAKSREELEACKVQVFFHPVGPLFCYSHVGDTCGFYDTRTGEATEYSVPNGFYVTGMIDDTLIGYSQGGEGAYFPSQANIVRYSMDSGSLEYIPLPENAWPGVRSADNRYQAFSFPLTAQIKEMIPSLAGEEESDSVYILVVYDLLELKPVGYLARPGLPIDIAVLSEDGRTAYCSASFWSEDYREFFGEKYYRFELTPVDEPEKSE